MIKETERVHTQTERDIERERHIHTQTERDKERERHTHICSTHIKLLIICLVSSELRELAKLMKEQYTAIHAHHFN